MSFEVGCNFKTSLLIIVKAWAASRNSSTLVLLALRYWKHLKDESEMAKNYKAALDIGYSTTTEELSGNEDLQ